MSARFASTPTMGTADVGDSEPAFQVGEAAAGVDECDVDDGQRQQEVQRGEPGECRQAEVDSVACRALAGE